MPALDPETRERWRDMVVVDQDLPGLRSPEP